MCEKFSFDSIPDCYKIQEMRDRTIFDDTFILVYCLDKCKTQRMCDEAAEDCLASLKCIPSWFFTS